MKKLSYIGILIYASMGYIFVLVNFCRYMNQKIYNDNILQRSKRVFKRMLE